MEPSGRVVLSREGVKLVRKGSLSIYNKWILDATPGLKPGDVIRVYGIEEGFLGVGFYETYGAIGVRFLTRVDEPVDEHFLKRRLRAAAERRRRMGLREFYRLVHAEADQMPGLVVDYYKDIAVVQSSCSGFDRLLTTLAEAIADVLGVSQVYVRNDARSRREVGLPTYRGRLLGEGDSRTAIREGAATFIVDVLKGQKTGFYIDQRPNRVELEQYVREGDKVLDLYSYSGGFGMHAAMMGAEVTFVEESPIAMELCKENAKLNDVEDRCRFMQAKVKEFLVRDEGKYDVVVIDPPALAQSQEQLGDAVKTYFAVNTSALSHLKTPGVLFTSSCSFFVSQPQFRKVILDAFKRVGLKPYFMGRARGPSPCHPIDPKNPATAYLKAYYILAEEA
ncbi:MAG: class I SAM-dependent rRNA methyltransferase [Thermoproteota archaeon]|nr:MAG: class I SAM-dependent rRNA methyltransferase [Candidatus Korarchaeota archaeon]